MTPTTQNLDKTIKMFPATWDAACAVTDSPEEARQRFVAMLKACEIKKWKKKRGQQ